MSCRVRREFFGYSAQVCNLFQIGIHFLIAGNGQEAIFVDAVWMILVPVQYFNRGRKQWNTRCGLCLLAMGEYPFFTVDAR